MRRTSFTKILVTFGLIALMPASANALVTTYKNLTCKAHGYNQSGDARWDLTIKNTGRMTVPSRAGYHVRYISPNMTFIAKLSPELKPAETRTTATQQFSHDPRACTVYATWWIPTEVIKH